MSQALKIFTIGFTKKSLRDFITLLQEAGVEKVIDVRLNNTSQLAGYAKKDDLAFVLSLVGIGYEHHTELAPTEELMNGFKQKKISQTEFEAAFNQLMDERQPRLEERGKVCLLCSEEKPAACHRRLVAEYFTRLMPGATVTHL